MSIRTNSISTYFIWRRVHSLMGLWLVLYLTIHLITNSQAALWFGDDGSGFVRLVTSLERLPYLQVIETVLIGIPFLIHGVWGVKRALESRNNAPAMNYERNWAFTLQRWSSWILLIGVTLHVVQMRFLDAPKKTRSPVGEQFLTKLSFDEGLYTLSDRLKANIYTKEDIEKLKKQVTEVEIMPRLGSEMYNAKEDKVRALEQKSQEQNEWIEALASYHLKPNEVITAANRPGTAFLLMVRDTFKSPLMGVLYTIFLLAAAFHAFNGFWTFLITWGIILSYRSQKAMIPVSVIGILVLAFLGLAAIWCSYFVNLRY